MTPLQRRPDWQERLAQVVNERRSLPYVYGSTDCFCFMRAAVEAVTGVLLLPDLELPRTWMAAAKTMLAHGWESIPDMGTALLGPALADPFATGPGDVVCYEQAGDLHLAVRVGDAALAPAAEGLMVVERGRWRLGWKVG